MANKSKFSVEKMVQIWNDSTGERVEVGPDRDGLDMIEIRSVTSDGKVEARISFPKDLALLVGAAFMEALSDNPERTRS